MASLGPSKTVRYDIQDNFVRKYGKKVKMSMETEKKIDGITDEYTWLPGSEIGWVHRDREPRLTSG